MNEPQKALITTLYESYDHNPVIKGLIQALNVAGIPLGAMIDSSLGSIVTKIQTERLRTFFDELNRGNVVLDESQIESNDFLHAYFETTAYVLRTRSNDKIIRFAKILKKVYSGSLLIEDFEDYTKIFNDLTDKEFAILSILYKHEQKHKLNPQKLPSYDLTGSYWKDFKTEIISSLNIKETEINSYLVRLQRTGCFMRLNTDGVLLRDKPDPDEKGNTTELFNAIMNLIKE